MKISISYRSVTWTAVVTALFSCIVGVSLIVDVLRRGPAIPLDRPSYVALKQQLKEGEGGEETQKQLVALDARLRSGFFHRRQFARRGGYLLAGGVMATVFLLQWASMLQRRLPKPVLGDGQTDRPSIPARKGQLAVLGIASVVFLATVVPAYTHPSALPRTMAHLSLSGDVDPNRSEVDAAGVNDSALAGSAASNPVLADTASTPENNRRAARHPSADEIAANWHRFRGLQGAGVATFEGVPESWDAETGEGILWKTAIELPGVSSPIIWGSRVFLTGADPERREVYCLDADDGSLLWNSPVSSAAPTSPEFYVDNSTGYAASTPTTDGERVYAIFANGDLAAFDFDGKQLWAKSLGIPVSHYGHASSLIMYEGLLIVQFDQGSRGDEMSRLTAFEGTTGETVWNVDRKVPASWATPIVAVHEGEARVITCADPWVIAYGVKDGHEIWRVDCLRGDVAPSPVYADGVVYVANDYAQVAGIRDGGEGDVTSSHVFWSSDYAMPETCSPLVTEAYLLVAPSYGGLSCYDRVSEDEEPLWEEDLGATMLVASPSLVRDRLYLIGEGGEGLVATVGENGLEEIVKNDLHERSTACPSFQPGRIYIRGEKHMFCIGQ